EKGMHKIREKRREMILMREREQRAAGIVLGIEKILFLKRIDGCLVYTPSLCRLLTRVIRVAKPDIILSPDPGNYSFDSFGRFHRDHRITAEAVFDAIYPAAGSLAFFPELAKKHILPHMPKEAWFYNTDRPDIYVDIGVTITLKLKALSMHASQIKDMEKVAAIIKNRAREIGRKKRVHYAEAFRRLEIPA
ncbi:MAG: GlcNAc-PI de-N-acetylase family, partial [Parcubacteria group bacterium Gr01-1014_66]